MFTSPSSDSQGVSTNVAPGTDRTGRSFLPLTTTTPTVSRAVSEAEPEEAPLFPRSSANKWIVSECPAPALKTSAG